MWNKNTMCLWTVLCLPESSASPLLRRDALLLRRLSKRRLQPAPAAVPAPTTRRRWVWRPGHTHTIRRSDRHPDIPPRRSQRVQSGGQRGRRLTAAKWSSKQRRSLAQFPGGTVRHSLRKWRSTTPKLSLWRRGLKIKPGFSFHFPLKNTRNQLN